MNHDLIRNLYRAARAVCFGVVFLAVAASIWAQRTRPESRPAEVEVSGNVRPADPNLLVELRGISGMPYRSDVDSTGYFCISGVSIGEYELRVLDLSGNVITREHITVADAMPPLALQLPEARREQPISGVISAQRLMHKVPGKAQKELKQADRAMERKDMIGSIAHLKKAIAIDPEFMEAHNNLGLRYLMTDQYDLAVEQFRKAAEIDPHASVPWANTAATLLAMGEVKEAERAAGRALDLDASNTRAHYLLAIALLRQNKSIPEAIAQLRLVTDQFPQARVLLGQALVSQGDTNSAATEFKAYLATNRPEHRDEVKAWLAHLEKSRLEGSAGSPSAAWQP